jgi:hypothetical protein
VTVEVNMRTQAIGVGVVMVALFATSGLVLAAGQQLGAAGSYQATTVAGPAPSTFGFSVNNNLNRVTWFDGENYWWGANDGRYERGDAWIEFNTEGEGWQFQPSGGGTPSAGSYQHVGS